MCEKEFTRFVRQLKDQESVKDKASRASRPSIKEVIHQTTPKQTCMETKSKCNGISQEDAMNLAFADILKDTQCVFKSYNKTILMTGDSKQSKKDNDGKEGSKSSNREDRLPD